MHKVLIKYFLFLTFKNITYMFFLFCLGDGECCDTMFGHMCCPDDYPVCKIFGCTK